MWALKEERTQCRKRTIKKELQANLHSWRQNYNCQLVQFKEWPKNNHFSLLKKFALAPDQAWYSAAFHQALQAITEPNLAFTRHARNASGQQGCDFGRENGPSLPPRSQSGFSPNFRQFLTLKRQIMYQEFQRGKKLSATN